VKAFYTSFTLLIVVGTLLAVLPTPRPLPHVAQEQPREYKATVLFGGDMMFDRSIRTTMEVRGDDFIFSCIDEVLLSADVVVANLEGPITAHASVSVGSTMGSSENYYFTFATSTAALLARHAVFLVNLGNNHILNFGTDGVAQTKRYLSDAGVSYFGDPISQSAAVSVINGVPLAFITFNEFTPKTYGGAAGSAASTLAQIRKAKVGGYLPMVYAHWGIEYASTSPAYVRGLAHQFVDAGAKLVIGSHPHVVEEHEEYNGASIYYSLGNFIFDQYFSDAVDHGLLLRVTFDANGVAAIEELPTHLTTDRRVCPARLDTKAD
jgi:poly-gamma-glutamate synthesis protein (capsule biosynthesis protein)